ncbi:kinase-like domain-containing protein [Xylariaceae sp. FL0594]|nr:kinase-like domain-containing protein [Xylariaceae sp. FL0594]
MEHPFSPRLKLEALLALAEALRGRPCSCDVTQKQIYGTSHWAIFIAFDDGVEWAFRTPHRGGCTYSEETGTKILVSEACTLLYLRKHTSIPVPDVYSFSGTSDNEIGLPYILQSKASDHALPLADSDREKIMRQLGTIMAELSEHRFDKIGSLFDNEAGSGTPSVGECLSPCLAWQSRDEVELERGPFSNEPDYLCAQISAFTTHVEELNLHPHLFIAPDPYRRDYETAESSDAASRRWYDFVVVGEKIRHSNNTLQYCMAGQFMCDMIPHLACDTDDGFVLSHPDLHLGNIFVDDELNITCIIDWSSTTTGPLTELLATPALGGLRDSPSKSLVAAFRDAYMQRSPNMAAQISRLGLWRKSEMMWYFCRLTRLLCANDFALFKGFFSLACDAEAPVETREDREEGLNDRIFRMLRERLARDENKKLIAEHQEEMVARPDALAVARKLTLMSEMNPYFVADRTLWRWVEEACKLYSDNSI